MYTQCQYLPSFYAGDVSGQQPTHSATVLEWEIAFTLLYQVRSLQEYNSLFITLLHHIYWGLCRNDYAGVVRTRTLSVCGFRHSYVHSSLTIKAFRRPERD